MTVRQRSGGEAVKIRRSETAVKLFDWAADYPYKDVVREEARREEWNLDLKLLLVERVSMNMEKTLILLKPDCIHRRLVGAIVQRFEQKGLRLAGMKLVQVSRSLAEKHYAVHKGKAFYESLLQFITSGPTLALVLEGREAVAVARNLIGATDGAKAAPGTIRGDFALSVQNNLVHGSDSPENAAAEVALWFKPEELVSYQPVDSPWIAGG
jgi:nucleoside-diphosphate kinase